MDELELLKKDWQQQKEIFPKVSYEDIYAMLLKKSSSIVHWILIISIIEFSVFAIIDIIFRFSDGYEKAMTTASSKFALTGAICFYLILSFFVYRFYKNYKKIRVTDSVKGLMQTILEARRTVKMYVLTNITFIAITVFSSVMYLSFFTKENHVSTFDPQIPPALLIVVSIVVVGLLALGVGLFYRVIYGILTNKLKKNYKELEKLEV